MPTLQEQYFQAMQQSQQAVLDAFSTWTRTVQDAAGSIGTNPVQVDPAQAIDQYFDFAAKVLDVQRTLTRGIVERTTSLTEDLANRAAEAAGGEDSTGL
ncbi:hypothetical protein CLV92_11555 [Kineococcus xinjiangensis]|uniref:Uncharacterized protein n=1 Tax=Kineococcus xinjiangensis TaxID=512762 RepID=A0A2S6IDN1_9ACTN|nr:hypothetical protein [Kineococcus xinjiangensis]PPK92309.1 hypothetical protein CLV92_11555 [Kineococcus xinjiangensis]